MNRCAANNYGLVLVDAKQVARLEARLAQQAETIADLQCQLHQLKGRAKAVKAKQLIKPATVKCATSGPKQNCGC